MRSGDSATFLARVCGAALAGLAVWGDLGTPGQQSRLPRRPVSACTCPFSAFLMSLGHPRSHVVCAERRFAVFDGGEWGRVRGGCLRERPTAALLPSPTRLQAFNTFIDDVFAFIITMPTSHRLACFRDDVVFLVYLYQRW